MKRAVFTLGKSTIVPRNLGMVIIIFACFLFIGKSYGQTLTTDKQDYSPGSTVYFTGTGFGPNESVKMQVNTLTFPNDDSTSSAHQPWYVTTDANGNFQTTWYVPIDQDENGASLMATADGQTSGLHAEAFFTDAVPTLKLYSESGRSASSESDAFAWSNTVYVKITGATNANCYQIIWKQGINTIFTTSSASGGGTTRSIDVILPDGPSGIWTAELWESSNCINFSLISTTTRTFDVARLLIIGASDDNEVNEGSPTNNVGSGIGTSMQVNSKTGNHLYTFVKFSTSSIPNPSTVTDAKLRLFMRAAPTVSCNYDAKIVTANWVESGLSGITWNNQPGVVATASDQQPTGTTDNTLIRWTVTADVNSMANGGTNYGWRISDNVENTTSNFISTFQTTEDGGHLDRDAPLLLVDYNPCVAPTSATAGSDSPICQGATLHLTSSVTGGSPAPTASWSGTGTFSPSNTDPNPTVTGAASVTYTVTYTNACGSVHADAPVTVTSTVGTPTAITVSSGTEPTCQLTNGTTTTTYATTATNSTGFNWSLSDGSAGSIGASSGIMTWANGFSGSVDIRVTANGCNGPSSQVTRTVTVTPTVGTPTAITVSAGSEPTCQLTNGTTTTTYATTATDNTGFNWSLSDGSAGSIGATTGIMTWANGFSGSVDIQVTASGCNGPSSQVTRTVTVTPTVGTPTAITVSAGSEPACQLTNGTTTTTYATTATNSTGFNWSLSDGSAGSIDASTGIMTWANGFSGSVDIQVTANGCNGPSSQVTRTVTITPTVGTPTAITVSAGAEPTCQLTDGTTTTTYATTATNSTGFNWSLSDASAGSIDATTGVMTWADAYSGSVDIRVTANGCNGPSSQVTRTVTVTPSVGIPTPITISSGTEPTCQLTNSNTITNYATTASNSTGFNWSLSDGLAGDIGTTGNMVWANGFSGSVDIRVTANGCNGPSEQVTRTVTIAPTVGTPTAITISDGTEPTCQLTNGTTTTTYATTATDNTGFNWSLSDGSAGSIGASTGVMTWANGFSGSVDIRVTANGCNGPSSQVTRTVTITPTVGTPTAITVSSGTEPICQLTNGTTTTTYATTATNNTGFNWSLSDGSAGSIVATTGIMTWANGFSGSVDIRVTANGCNGPSSQVTRTVTVLAPPSAATAGSNSPICEDSTLYLAVSVTGAVNFSWTGPNGFTATNQNPNLPGANAVNASGTYYVTASNTCGSSQSSTDVTVIPSPFAGFAITTYSGPFATIHVSGTPNTEVTYNKDSGPNTTINLDGNGNASLYDGVPLSTTDQVYNLVSARYLSGPECIHALSGHLTLGLHTAIFYGTRDSYIRDGADNTNEGHNPLLRISNSGNNRTIVGFTLPEDYQTNLLSARLILNIADNSDNWGGGAPGTRYVDACRVLTDWTEGNGWNENGNIRGTGTGVTWTCANDANIANTSQDGVKWTGGTFATATAPGVLHYNGLVGEVSWDVTSDVMTGAPYGWIIKKRNEGINGRVYYQSRENSKPPRLELTYVTNISSKVIIPGDQGEGNVQVSIFPNPAKESFTLHLDHSINQAGILTLHDMRGTVILYKELQLQEGVNNYPVSVDGISDGIYIVRLQTGTGVWQTRLIINR